MAQPTLSIRTLLAVPARAVIRAGLACLTRWIDLPAHPHESAGERAAVISDGCHLPAQRPDLRSTGDTTGVLSNHSTRSFSSDSGRQQERWISQEGPRPPANRCKSCHVEGAARRRPKRPWRTTANLPAPFPPSVARLQARAYWTRMRTRSCASLAQRHRQKSHATAAGARSSFRARGTQVRPAITHSQSFAVGKFIRVNMSPALSVSPAFAWPVPTAVRAL